MTPAPSRRGYLGRPGAQVHYRTAGTGSPLLLLAPTPRSSSYYLTLLPHLPDFQVVAVDTPGFGLSDEIPGEWTMTDVAERLADALDELGLADWNVLGIHSGNKIGAALCTVRPEMVRRFLFAGMTHSIILDNDLRNRTMRRFYSSPDAVVDPADPPRPDVRQVQRWRYVRATIDAIWSSYDPARAGAEWGARRAAVLRHVADEVMGFDSFDKLYAANFGFDLDGALRAMPVETVVMEMVVPGEDHLDRQADVLVAAMPRACAVTLTGSDRVLVTTEAAAFADVIRAVLATTM